MLIITMVKLQEKPQPISREAWDVTEPAQGSSTETGPASSDGRSCDRTSTSAERHKLDRAAIWSAQSELWKLTQRWLTLRFFLENAPLCRMYG
ncbi:hypothetical protein SKAU_G00302920 [Synaphobranchus kaupii]|uniref:Uncharacterized protein n=1 Tax=Synaphobranchus kaupii TaxID=118154 RepID=A0A9Q1EW34_SYNKA|nr:hypothetical protein SKAU_G00302920 [Synaphobranchus kaupii]